MKSGMDVALDSLSRRAMTAYQLEKRLVDKGFNPSEVTEILSRLSEWGYINDYRFASEFCCSRQSRYSRLRMRNELKQKGIKSSIIDKVMSESYPEMIEIKQCSAFAEQLWEEVARHQERKQIRKSNETIQLKLSEISVSVDAQANLDFNLNDSLNEAKIEQKVGYKLAQKGYPYEIIREVISNLKVNRKK